MSKFLKLVSRYNNLLSEADQISQEDDENTSPDVAENPQAATEGEESAELQQVSPTIPSELPTQEANPPMNDDGTDVETFLGALNDFFEQTYEGDENFKNQVINALSGRTNATNLPSILKKLTDLLSPSTTTNPQQQIKNTRQDLNNINSDETV